MKQTINCCLHNPETVSVLQWDGSRSQRFKGGRHHYASASKDNFFEGTVIAKEMDAFDKGRKHYNNLPAEAHSLVTPRYCLRTYDLQEKFKTLEKPIGLRAIHFEPIHIKQRAERLHIRDDRQPLTIYEKSQGIKTNQGSYKQALKHYIVEDRMQRKIRARRPDKSTYFGDVESRKTVEPHPEDFGASRRRLYRSIDASYSLNDSIEAARKLDQSTRSRFVEFDSLRPAGRPTRQL